MKKITAFILTAGILLSLCACGNGRSGSVIEAETTTEKISETVAEILTEITTSTTKQETTTEKETTTKLDLSRLSTGYIKTAKSGGKTSLFKEADEKSAEIDMLTYGAEIKIIEKEGGWYKVYANGKTGYVKAEYITDKKPVAFTKGDYKKAGTNYIYYNEWANLKIATPEDWSKELANSLYKYEIYKSSPDFEPDSFIGIAVLAAEGPIDLIFKSDFGYADETVDMIRQESETVVFAGEEYNVWDYEGTASSFDIFDLYSHFCTRYYYREVDGYSIVISLLARQRSEMDVYLTYISKIK